MRFLLRLLAALVAGIFKLVTGLWCNRYLCTEVNKIRRSSHDVEICVNGIITNHDTIRRIVFA